AIARKCLTGATRGLWHPTCPINGAGMAARAAKRTRSDLEKRASHEESFNESEETISGQIFTGRRVCQPDGLGYYADATRRRMEQENDRYRGSADYRGQQGAGAWHVCLEADGFAF